MCFVYRHRHICCDCNRIMSSKDKAGWCEKRTWVRPSPFEHAVAHCPKGTRLAHVDYKVVRCVDCHFDSPRATGIVDMPPHEEDRRQQPRRRRQGQYDEPLEGNEDVEPSNEAPGLMQGLARYVSSALGWNAGTT